MGIVDVEKSHHQASNENGIIRGLFDGFMIEYFQRIFKIATPLLQRQGQLSLLSHESASVKRRVAYAGRVAFASRLD